MSTIDDAPTLAHRCRTTQTFATRSAADVYRALYEFEQWPEHLPHVTAITPLYDDGMNQEFLMSVEDGPRLEVRSVRACREALIEWFQPEPPPFLRHHGGTWKFRDLPGGGCAVEATHAWNLREDVAGEAFPPTDEATTAQQVQDLLLNHSKLALRTWHQVLEPETVAAGAGR
jgi:hypothetical protein